MVSVLVIVIVDQNKGHLLCYKVLKEYWRQKHCEKLSLKLQDGPRCMVENSNNGLDKFLFFRLSAHLRIY